MKTTTNKSICPVSCCGLCSGAAPVQKFGRDRSIKKFCEDEGYDYWKFCKPVGARDTESAT